MPQLAGELLGDPRRGWASNACTRWESRTAASSRSSSPGLHQERLHTLTLSGILLSHERALRALPGDLAALLSPAARRSSRSTRSTCTRRSSASASCAPSIRRSSRRCGSASRSATSDASTAWCGSPRRRIRSSPGSRSASTSTAPSRRPTLILAGEQDRCDPALGPGEARDDLPQQPLRAHPRGRARGLPRAPRSLLPPPATLPRRARSATPEGSRPDAQPSRPTKPPARSPAPPGDCSSSSPRSTSSTSSIAR